MPVEHAALAHDLTSLFGASLPKEGAIEADGESVDFTHVLHGLKAAEITPQQPPSAAVPTETNVGDTDNLDPSKVEVQPPGESADDPAPRDVKPTNGPTTPVVEEKLMVPVDPQQPVDLAEEHVAIAPVPANSKVDVASLVRAALPLAPTAGQRVFFSAPEEGVKLGVQSVKTPPSAKGAVPDAPQFVRPDQPMTRVQPATRTAEPLPQRAALNMVEQVVPQPSPAVPPPVVGAPIQALAAKPFELPVSHKNSPMDKAAPARPDATTKPPATKAAQTTAPVDPPSKVLPTPTLDGTTTKTFELPVAFAGDEQALSVGSARVADAITGASVLTATSGAAPQLMRQIAPQLAVVLQAQADGTTEIRLDPKELGRVTISLMTTDGVIAMAVQAERPETADMMRRHIETLAQEFRDMGYDNLTFSFGSHSEQTEHSDSDAEPSATDDVSTTAASAEKAPLTARSAGLDLRL